MSYLAVNIPARTVTRLLVSATLVALFAAPMAAHARHGEANPASISPDLTSEVSATDDSGNGKADEAKAALKAAGSALDRGERKTKLAEVAGKWRDAPQGAEAARALAYVYVGEKNFADAESWFQQAAKLPAAASDVAGESLLQTGFLSISRFWASTDTEAVKAALLQDALNRLSGIAKGGGSGTAAATTRSFAASGCGEVLLLQGNPVQAEQWYRQALSNTSGVEPTALTLATYGLGVSLYRQGRYSEALQVQTQVTTKGATGKVLRGLLVSPGLPAKASLWRAAALSHLGQKNAAVAALDDSLSLQEILKEAPGGNRLLAQAEVSKGRLRQDIQVAQEREELLLQAKRLAADTRESPMKSFLTVMEEQNTEVNIIHSTKSGDRADRAGSRREVKGEKR